MKQRLVGLAKVLAVLAILFFFFGEKLTSFNDSYEESFCKSYNTWNKYSWGVLNNESPNWQKWEREEYQKLRNLVDMNDPYGDSKLSKFAIQWFKDGEMGDLENGRIMASLLIVECEKIGVQIDRDYLPKN